MGPLEANCLWRHILYSFGNQGSRRVTMVVVGNCIATLGHDEMGLWYDMGMGFFCVSHPNLGRFPRFPKTLTLSSLPVPSPVPERQFRLHWRR
jgi:hypothetical protein